jgi:hypothetical protein
MVCMHSLYNEQTRKLMIGEQTIRRPGSLRAAQTETGTPAKTGT